MQVIIYSNLDERQLLSLAEKGKALQAEISLEWDKRYRNHVKR